MSQINVGQVFEALNNKMDSDGGNSSIYMLSQKDITNCITEIPQDIKLELNAGILTLKAGSKVYIPNGEDVFNVITVASDLTMGPVGSYTGTDFIYVRNDGSMLDHGITPEATSGTEAPTGIGFWYDTTNNLIKIYYDGSDTGVRTSFPIAVVHRTNGTWDSIDQVFNGFGYIGSILFALPGVKGLIPNGRNEDGTLKNLPFVSTNVSLQDYSSVTGTTRYFAFNGIGFVGGTKYYIDKNPNTLVQQEATYLTEKNIIKRYGVSANEIYDLYYVIVGTVEIGNQKITKLSNKIVFHAVDYNEADFVIAYQTPNSSNNYTWYRLYKSGWVEQGGRISLNGAISSTNKRVDFPIKMANSKYNATVDNNANVAEFVMVGWEDITSMSIGTASGSTTKETTWRVEGMAA